MNNLKILPSSTSFRAMKSRRMGKVMHNNARGLLKSLAVAVPLAFGVMNAPAKTNADCYTPSEQCCNHKCNKTSFSNNISVEEKNDENNPNLNSENKNFDNLDLLGIIGVVVGLFIVVPLALFTDD